MVKHCPWDWRVRPQVQGVTADLRRESKLRQFHACRNLCLGRKGLSSLWASLKNSRLTLSQRLSHNIVTFGCRSSLGSHSEYRRKIPWCFWYGEDKGCQSCIPLCMFTYMSCVYIPILYAHTCDDACLLHEILLNTLSFLRPELRRN